MAKSIKELSSVTRVGLDIGKRAFQIHAVDAQGAVLAARALRRSQVLSFFEQLPRCLIGMEACGSAHHWARALIALGHEVRLMPPAYVKPYVRRSKNDAVDAAAICEAASRPSMRFVPVRSVENQAGLMRHRVRELLVGQRTQALNAMRSHLAEVGIIAASGAWNAHELKRLVAEGVDANGEIVIADCVRASLASLARQIDALDCEIATIDEEIKALTRADATASRLMTIPGVGPIIASAIVATVMDVGAFASGRNFAAYLGLTPRQDSTAGKQRLGRISKMGDRYLRKLLVVGACAALYRCREHRDALRVWAAQLLTKKKVLRHGFKLTAVAYANKLARIIFALLTKGGVYCDLPTRAEGPIAV
jgi:transposase